MKKKRLNRLLSFLIFILIHSVAYAQNMTIGGIVSDEKGEPLIGVSIQLKNASIGTITDLDGNYQITAPPQGTLIFSYLGHQTENIAINSRKTINVVLKEDSKVIGEVVVVGYGVQRKSDLTGAISSVKAEDMLNVPTTSIGEMLRGRVAGVEISQASARPGGGADILIRGKRSLSAGNSPLFIVDGAPVDNIDDINANDIQRVEVLKDASSQAIYGARASAGVILITTRRGVSGKTTIDFSSNLSVQSLKRNFDLMSPTEWVEMLLVQKGEYGGINSVDESLIASAIDDQMLYENYKKGRTTNWEKELIKSAFIQSYNLSLRGGSDKTNFALSFNYYDQDGMLKNTGFKRGTSRLNIDHAFLKRFKIGANISYARSEQMSEDGITGGSSTSGGTTLYRQALTMSPYASPYAEDGSLLQYINSNNNFNPLWNMEQSSDKRLTDRFLFNIFADWEIIKGLKYRLNANINYRERKRESFESSLHEQGLKKHGWGQEAFDKNYEWLIENILTYDKAVNANNRFDITLMQSANKFREELFSLTATDFITDHFKANGMASSALAFGKPQISIKPRQLVSFMSRARYTLMEKYLFSASLRYDGSSVFGVENKWGFFPSASAGWRISEEGFMKNADYLSNLKLRVSYGVVGNQGTGSFQSMAYTSTSEMIFGDGTDYVLGLLPSDQMPNPFLKWERTASTNIGLDFGFLKDRITGSVEWYDTRTRDLLIRKKLPSSTGYATQMSNLGEVKNTGIEVQLGATPIRKNDLVWSMNMTFSSNRGKIVKIDGKTDDNGKPLDQPDQNWFIGSPIGVYYDYEFDGIFNDIEEVRNSAQGKDAVGNPLPDSDLLKKVGQIRVKDRNKDGIITEDDRKIMNNNPDWIGSFSTNVSYKGFEFLIDFYAVQGIIRRNIYLSDYNEGGSLSGKLNGIKRNYWTPEGRGQEAPLPRINTPDPYMRSLSYQDASYLRIRTIQLGYNVPKKLLSHIGCSNMKIYATATNFFTWTKFQSFSPEAGLSSYPEPKVLSIGLNASF